MFTSNSANHAGAVYTSGSVTFTSTKITQNTAYVAYGSICMAVSGHSTYTGYLSSSPPSFTFAGRTQITGNTGDLGSGCTTGQYITSFDMTGAQFNCATCPTGRSVSGVSCSC